MNVSKLKLAKQYARLNIDSCASIFNVMRNIGRNCPWANSMETAIGRLWIPMDKETRWRHYACDCPEFLTENQFSMPTRRREKLRKTFFGFKCYDLIFSLSHKISRRILSGVHKMKRKTSENHHLTKTTQLIEEQIQSILESFVDSKVIQNNWNYYNKYT